jgi:hypothetical protein
VAVAVDAAASVAAEDYEVVAAWAQAVEELSALQEAVIVAADSVAAADARLRCRDLPGCRPR